TTNHAPGRGSSSAAMRSTALDNINTILSERPPPPRTYTNKKLFDLVLRKLSLDIDSVCLTEWNARDVARIVFACGLLAKENPIVADVLLAKFFPPSAPEINEGLVGPHFDTTDSTDTTKTPSTDGIKSMALEEDNAGATEQERGGETTSTERPRNYTPEMEDQDPLRFISTMNADDVVDCFFGFAKLRPFTFSDEHVDFLIERLCQEARKRWPARILREQGRSRGDDDRGTGSTRGTAAEDHALFPQTKNYLEFKQTRLPQILWAAAKLPHHAALRSFALEKVLPIVEWFPTLLGKPALFAEA
ncbi:unnamed protein product, partial [Amoebophrya sp. A120]